MHPDVTTFWQFYYETHLGAVTQRALQRALRGIWPNCRAMTVAGYGFAAPFLAPFRQEATRTLCLMPAAQGARVWPREGASLTALVEHTDWALPNGFIDRLVLAHAIEHEAQLDTVLSEAWRVLAPEGRVILIAPNRTGVWARSDTTPFGSGRPFTFQQIESLLSSHDLTPKNRSAALYMPPSGKRFWLRSAPTLERIGQRIDVDRLAGVLIVEAEKRVFAMPKGGAREGVKEARQPIRGLAPAGGRARDTRSND